VKVRGNDSPALLDHKAVLAVRFTFCAKLSYCFLIYYWLHASVAPMEIQSEQSSCLLLRPAAKKRGNNRLSVITHSRPMFKSLAPLGNNQTLEMKKPACAGFFSLKLDGLATPVVRVSCGV
jgi:hypothetical protein